MSRSGRLIGTTLATLTLLFAGSVSAFAAPPGSPVDNPKASSPDTDLAHYPKRQDVPGTKAATSSGTVQPSVEVATVDSQGRHDVYLYDPAPGISSETLVAMLRANGKPTAQLVPSEAGTSSQSASEIGSQSVAPAYNSQACSYGTARSEQCAPIHWANNGHSHPQVYFDDLTGANWPVDQAVYTWNEANGIDSHYAYGYCPSVAGSHCVSVADGNYGATGWSGLTHYSWDANRNLVDGSVYSSLNDYYSYNADGYRQDACHELGHALGLGHNQQNYSCLWYQIVNSAHTVPDSDDFNMLASIYSVAH